MSMEGTIIAGLLALITLAWVAAPLRSGAEQRATDDAARQKRRERLLVYYERVLTNVRDLDEDRATGKMAAEAYEQEREAWVHRGIQALKALDALDQEQPEAAQAADAAAIDRDIDHAIEAAVAAYRHR